MKIQGITSPNQNIHFGSFKITNTQIADKILVDINSIFGKASSKDIFQRENVFQKLSDKILQWQSKKTGLFTDKEINKFRKKIGFNVQEIIIDDVESKRLDDTAEYLYKRHTERISAVNKEPNAVNNFAFIKCNDAYKDTKELFTERFNKIVDDAVDIPKNMERKIIDAAKSIEDARKEFAKSLSVKI